MLKIISINKYILRKSKECFLLPVSLPHQSCIIQVMSLSWFSVQMLVYVWELDECSSSITVTQVDTSNRLRCHEASTNTSDELPSLIPTNANLLPFPTFFFFVCKNLNTRASLKSTKADIQALWCNTCLKHQSWIYCTILYPHHSCSTLNTGSERLQTLQHSWNN